MKPNRRQLLALITSAGTVALAGCGGGDGDGDGGDGEDGGESDGGDDTDGSGGNGDDGTGDTTTQSDAGGDGSTATATDDSGTSTDGATDSDEQLQPSDLTGSVESSVPEVEVLGHEVTSVDPQVRIDLELRNAGDESNIDFTHHNFDAGLFDADGNDITGDQATRGPEDFTGAGETGVVELFLPPEPGTTPASYEVSINCDLSDTENSGFNYCEG